MSADEGFGDRPDRLGGEADDPALAGVAVAVAAAVSTMAVCLLVADGPLALLRDASGETLPIPSGVQIGWAFLAAHGVPLHVTAERWMLRGDLVQSPVILLIPPATLFIGGYLVARLDDRGDLISGARAGSWSTVGYLLVVGILLVSTRYRVSSSYADVSIHADLVRGLLVGLGYPLAFGGSGGAVAGALHGRFGAGTHPLDLVGLGCLVGVLVGAVAWAAV